MTLDAFATFTLNSRSILVDLSVPGRESIFRSFCLDRGPTERTQSLKDRAYFESDIWARTHGLTLQSFRAA